MDTEACGRLRSIGLQSQTWPRQLCVQHRLLKRRHVGGELTTKAIRASSCPNHTLGSKPIFLPSKACNILVSLRQTVFTLLPGMLLAYETRDCICSLQEDPLFDTHPSSICQSFFWQGELVFAPMKVKRESLTHSNSNFFFFKFKLLSEKFVHEKRPIAGLSLSNKKTLLKIPGKWENPTISTLYFQRT